MPTKNKGGRPSTEVNWKMVQDMAAIQCTRDEIASVMNIERRTLQRRCEAEFGCTLGEKLEEWREGGKASLRRTQWLLAQKNPTMAIFLGKQVLGQRDDIHLMQKGKIVHEVINYGDIEAKPWSDEG